MKLLIDAGNTRIKWALSDGENWLCRGDIATGQVGRLLQDIDEQSTLRFHGSRLHDIKQIWVSNVAGEKVTQIIRDIGAGFLVEPHFAVARKAQCGVRNGYSGATELGSDRWTALISAWDMVKVKCLVVNSGTATTIDTLSEQGDFTGGLILPGVELMQRSLVEATNRLKPSRGEYAPFPLNSADAIYSGAIQASCGAIERQYLLLNDDRSPLILSGGNAALLQPYLNQKIIKVRPRIVDNLVLRGLLVMAEEANCN
jgi:type III pantothenate kinase